MSKKVVALILSLMVVVMLAGCKDEVVATVNGEKIIAKELELSLAVARSKAESLGNTDFSSKEGQKKLEKLKLETLEEMINNRIEAQEAKKTDSLTKTRINEILDRLREEGQFASEEAFLESFDQFYGLTKEDYAHIVNMRDKMAEEAPKVTEADARRFYDDNPDERFSISEKFRTRHVLFSLDTGDGEKGRHSMDEAWAVAMGVIDRLNEGVNFAVIATEESEDQSTKQNGGEYNFTDDGSTAPEYVAAVRGLFPGEYTLFPIQTQYGFHVILLEDYIPADRIPFEEEKENIINYLSNLEVQKYINEKMMEARGQAEIINKLTSVKK